MSTRPKQRKGFAVMDPVRRRQIARMGGIAAHRQGTGHEWDSAEAKAAGEKGGAVTRDRRARARRRAGEV